MPATRITTRRAMRTATKAQLREEIAELRSIGRQMATICFNVTQGRRLTAYDSDIIDGVRIEWDAIKHREEIH